MKNVLFTDVLCLKPGLKVSEGLIHVCICVAFKTLATTSQVSRSATGSKTGRALGSVILFQISKLILTAYPVKVPCCKLEN